ncbi:dynamin family protein [Trichocladium antarcticum]|uniref:Dynamin family protein n=1 Tax=Trichocladium antarcticum TaxID=1450529 RepID=A0AAN6UL79_9PEZI|nr:dynamin family protein [Trichocladium antarcticum]
MVAPLITTISGEPTPLQSRDHRDLLDIVDRLRSQGLSRYVDLPQIIVCGDQSSGKSSALEAISGMSFPAKDNLCTRFATELILRRTPTAGVDIRITPGPGRSDEEKARLNDLTYKGALADLDIGHVIDDAKSAMDLDGNSKVFSTDTLRIEISGPSQPHLTMVDLPGLFLAGNKDQSAEDASIVEALVLSYMKKPRTIILAVVSAKSDFALQQVTRHTRALDPQGTRTLGLITKPDTLDEGSDSERFYVELAQNKDVHFRLGWHLPSVLDDVMAGVEDCKNILARLGTARGTIAEQRRYLLNVSAGFSNLTKAAIDGVRLRAVMQNTLAGFAKDIHKRGHARTIKEHLDPGFENVASEPDEDDQPCVVYRSEYIEEVRELMRKSRGRELPGTYNPMIVAELFSEQCKPWQQMVRRLLEQAVESVSTTVEAVVRHVADDVTAEELLRTVVDPALENSKRELTSKTDEILEPYISGHPITYNHYLTDNVQKAQARRARERIRGILDSFFRTAVLNRGIATHTFDMPALLNTLAAHTEPDMDTYSCSMAVDMMEAYYKVALKTLVDDVSVLAIERCLLQKLPSILSSDIICGLADEQIEDIAAESSESAAERALVTEKLGVLESGMAELKRLRMHSSASVGDDSHAA